MLSLHAALPSCFPALLPCSEVHCRPFRAIVRPRLFSVAVVVCGGREPLDDDLAIARAGFHSTGLCRMQRLSTPSGISLPVRSEEHTSELQSLMRISYAVFCLKQKKSHRDPIHRLPLLTQYTEIESRS